MILCFFIEGMKGIKLMLTLNNLYNMDCMEGMKEIPDKYFELAIVDPPYGIGINVNIGRRKRDKKSNYKHFAGKDKTIPNKDYFDDLFRISKNQIIWGGNYMTNFLYPSPCWLMWDKGFSEKVTFAQYELAWTSFSSPAKKYNYNAAKNNNRIHPTQKPIALYKWLLKNYANPGDKILDTHVGSGSSIIACLDLGFEYMGFELDEDYFKLMQERINHHKRKIKLF